MLSRRNQALVIWTGAMRLASPKKTKWESEFVPGIRCLGSLPRFFPMARLGNSKDSRAYRSKVGSRALMRSVTASHSPGHHKSSFEEPQPSARRRRDRNPLCALSPQSYDGSGSIAWENAGKMQKTGQRPISLARLKKLQARACEALPRSAR